jgi:hypothetical protein
MKFIRRLFRRPKQKTYADRIQERTVLLRDLNDDEWARSMVAFSDRMRGNGGR